MLSLLKSRIRIFFATVVRAYKSIGNLLFRPLAGSLVITECERLSK
jgi:hypothetical protein